MTADHFPPPRRRGLIVHAAILAILVSIAFTGIVNISRLEIGMEFLISLLAAVFSFLPIPIFSYRAYSLLRADYLLDRDSLAIHWGLRLEDIPLTDVEWMRPASDLTQPLSLPALHLPGGLIGSRRHPDLGLVEFLASDARKLLLVGTSKRVYVISPENPAALLQAFARATELGSIKPAEPRSMYPSFIVNQAWKSGLARFLLLSALFLNLGLFIWASFIIPTTPRVALVPYFAGSPLQTVPSSQLIIFPIASLLLSVVGWVAGLYFYRWERERVLALIVWGSSTLTGLLFLLSILFVITTPI